MGKVQERERKRKRDSKGREWGKGMGKEAQEGNEGDIKGMERKQGSGARSVMKERSLERCVRGRMRSSDA